MRSQKDKASDQIIKKHQVTLVELLDRLLDKGVMVRGDIMLSVADVDLVYLSLGLFLASIKTVENAASRGDHGEADLLSRKTSSQGEFLDKLQLEAGRKDLASPPLPEANSQSRNGNEQAIAKTLSSAIDSELNQRVEPKTNIDRENVEKGLAKLVLALVDLIRKLMEKQAIRRIEAGQLNAREIEDVGNAFFLLDEKMAQLKKVFGLTDEDLNLDLGPLGELF